MKCGVSIETARSQVASAIHANSEEIFFTSGVSESNSWVLRGVAESFGRETIHIITSSIEHHSVFNIWIILIIGYIM
jgi:cysteine desulfurase